MRLICVEDNHSAAIDCLRMNHLSDWPMTASFFKSSDRLEDYNSQYDKQNDNKYVVPEIREPRDVLFVE